MSNLTPVAPREFEPKEIDLIRDTVAKGASADEFKLFLYRCQHMNLDPLKPGQIHFIKYGNSPGTIVVGIEGFRVRAAKTGKHSGTKRGVIKDENGKCIGAWCEVYRSDWTNPAREEVSLQEYNTGKSAWAKMPETMIKKVAEAAALRMAFPDDLGGIYIREEMDQAENGRDVTDSQPQASSDSTTSPVLNDPWSYRLPETWKQNGGRSLSEIGADGVSKLIGWLKTLKDLTPKNKEILEACEMALKTRQDRQMDDELDRALANDGGW